MHQKLKTYYIQTLGCQMNYSDSERFGRILQQAGMKPVDSLQEADLAIVNTCSVKQQAEDRVIGLGRRIAPLKESKPNLQVILTGCMARRHWQAEPQGNAELQMTNEEREAELQALMPWLDHVVETKDFGQLINRLQGDSVTLMDVSDYLGYEPVYASKFQAYVPISTGCDHFCTYCIVPYARGREICRSAEDIIAEVWSLLSNGYKDITLLGQTVNRWINPDYDDAYKKGKIANTRIPDLNTLPLEEDQLAAWRTFFTENRATMKYPGMLVMPRDFLQLLQVLDQIPGGWWTTWMSSHPNYLTEELISFVAESVESAVASDWHQSHQRPVIHFALQSGSDKILSRMNRRHEIDEFVAKSRSIQQQVPQATLTTDVITGFPGETGQDLRETAQVMEQIGFAMAYISEFSPRSGTAASLIPDDVPLEVKAQRKEYLNDAVLAPSSRAHNDNLLGEELLVLVKDHKDGKYNTVTAHNHHLRIHSHQPGLTGQFVKAKVTAVTDWSLTGELVS